MPNNDRGAPEGRMIDGARIGLEARRAQTLVMNRRSQEEMDHGQT